MLCLSSGLVAFGTWSDGYSTFEGQFFVDHGVLERIAQEIDDLETMYGDQHGFMKIPHTYCCFWTG